MTYIYDPNSKPLELTPEAPEDDSPDLKDEEIESAIPISSLVEFAKIWRTQFFQCECGALRHMTKTALRRRKPKLYTRCYSRCENGHESQQTFVNNW